MNDFTFALLLSWMCVNFSTIRDTKSKHRIIISHGPAHSDPQHAFWSWQPDP